MQVRDVMTRGMESIDSKANIREAAQKMKQRNVGAVPISDGTKIVGMVTDRDIAVRAVAEGLDLEDSVSSVMSSKVYFCYDDQDIHDVAVQMEQKKVRRLLVYDRSDQPVGIVALGDLAVKGGGQNAEEALEVISEAPPNR